MAMRDLFYQWPESRHPWVATDLRMVLGLDAGTATGSLDTLLRAGVCETTATKRIRCAARFGRWLEAQGHPNGLSGLVASPGRSPGAIESPVVRLARLDARIARIKLALARLDVDRSRLTEEIPPI